MKKLPNSKSHRLLFIVLINISLVSCGVSTFTHDETKEKSMKLSRLIKELRGQNNNNEYKIKEKEREIQRLKLSLNKSKALADKVNKYPIIQINQPDLNSKEKSQFGHLCTSIKCPRDPSCNDTCEKTGECYEDNEQCIAYYEEDCFNSQICKSEGKCSVFEGKCVAIISSDCRSSTGCHEFGNCFAHKGSCIPGKDNDCKNSKSCKSSGDCGLLAHKNDHGDWKFSCGPRGVQDCPEEHDYDSEGNYCYEYEGCDGEDE